MKKGLSIILLTFLCTQNIAQLSNYWQQKVNYTIRATLNDQMHSINGFEKIEYINNSPDTLRFIWFHIWPNAYKNDKTAFSEQLLKNGRTDFYFSADNQKGYINQLNFSSNAKSLKVELHPTHIDIIKIILNEPLKPNSAITIETPFHVQLPYNFSRSGHIGNDYQATQWYPKPAVYDSKGWHEMPYLDQGEFYSEFGNFDVTIEVPSDYIVAATGELQNVDDLNHLKQLAKKQRNFVTTAPLITKSPKPFSTKKTTIQKPITAKKELTNFSKGKLKEFHYRQDNVHDFAWFASKNFVVEYDSLQLSDKLIDIFSFYTPQKATLLRKSTAIVKEAINYYSKWLGNYPYKTASVVCGIQDIEGGMEYPTITYISVENEASPLRTIIHHEIGHNWFYSILANNERDHAWMDEGMNTFYEDRIKVVISQNSNNTKKQLSSVAEDYIKMLETGLNGIQKSLPIDTTSDAFANEYYGLTVYSRAASWMKKLEKYLGPKIFDEAMHFYFETWKFKHPYPQDFKDCIELSSGKKIDSLFYLLYNTKPNSITQKKVLKPAFLINFTETEKYNYVSFAPAISYNLYDGLRVGALLHNYQIPLPKFQFFANPSFGTSSNNFNFFGKASYNVFKRKYWFQASVGLQLYTYDNFISDANEKFNLTIQRFTPSVKITLYDNDIKSTARTVIGFKTFNIKEQNLQFKTIVTPSGPKENITTPSVSSYINRIYINRSDNRVLYPYSTNLTIDQGADFIRTAFTAKQFFNYANKNGGIEARFFAGKFFYLGNKTFSKQFATDKYHLNLTGPKGYEDYTYSDYFVGRSEFEGWQSQQIMERDGFFKVNTDYLGSKVGKTDNWLMALNLSGDIPEKINPLAKLPIPIKLKFFIDIGTYAEAWQDNANSGKFLYAAGIQLPLFKEAVNIYFPILFSKVYRDYYQSILGENAFSKTISFSINLQKLSLNSLSRNIPL